MDGEMTPPQKKKVMWCQNISYPEMDLDAESCTCNFSTCLRLRKRPWERNFKVSCTSSFFRMSSWLHYTGHPKITLPETNSKSLWKPAIPKGNSSSKHCFSGATVDGRNPAPVDRSFFPMIYQVLYIQPVVVWDFFHQQYDGHFREVKTICFSFLPSIIYKVGSFRKQHLRTRQL